MIDPEQNAKDWRETEYKKLDTKILISLIMNATTLVFVFYMFVFFIGGLVALIG